MHRQLRRLQWRESRDQLSPKATIVTMMGNYATHVNRRQILLINSA